MADNQVANKQSQTVAKGSNLCGARLRGKPGRTCRRAAMANGRCRLHGGLSLAGNAHPNFRSGVRSKQLPVRLAARYQMGLTDPHLLDLKAEIGFVDVIMSDLTSRISHGETPQFISDLNELLTEAIRFYDDANEVYKYLLAIRKLISQRSNDYKTYDEIGKQIDRRQRLSESQRKMMIESQQMISVQELLVCIGKIIDVIGKTVSDKNLQMKISRGIMTMVEEQNIVDAEIVTP